MELQQLKYFKTVASIGKISDAAEAVFRDFALQFYRDMH